MKKYSLIIVFVLLFCFTPFKSLTANSSDVVINEIAWMGTDVSYNDEWIELYNKTENNINLEGWILKADDGAPEINLTGEIPTNGFYLLERTDDETVPGISADKIYTGALGNSGEDLKLCDNLNNLIDEVNCSEKWLAGDNITKQTMERKGTTNWQTSRNPGGTPKAENSQTEVRPPPSKTPELTPESAEVGPPPTYPIGIVFNEILPSPEGPDAEEEWIELYNQNNFEVNLASWQMKDKEGKTTTYTFSEGIKITALGYLVLKRPETKITLNNEGDGLELLNPKGELVNSINFGKAPQNQSYNKTPSGWVWKNIVFTPQPANEKTNEKKSEPAVDDSRQQPQKKELAAVSRQVPKSSGFLYTFLIAFGIALFSGIIILILKKKLTKNSRGIDKS